MRCDRAGDPHLTVAALSGVEHHGRFAYPVPMFMRAQEHLDGGYEAIVPVVQGPGSYSAVGAEDTRVCIQFQGANRPIQSRALPTEEQTPARDANDRALW